MRTILWSACEYTGCTAPKFGKLKKHRFCETHLEMRNAQRQERKRLYWERKTLTRKTDDYGYVSVRGDDGNWIHEHRLVMEQTLGRKLRKGESVHHKNGIRNDNDPANLELWVGPIRYGQRATDIRCHKCGEPYAVG